MLCWIMANTNPDAITTALIALAGAVIGGLITVEGRAKRRAKRDADRDDKLALAAARLMREDLRRAALKIKQAISLKEWWPRNVDLLPRVTIEDRRILATKLSDETWRSVVVAEADLELWPQARALTTQEAIDSSTLDQLENTIGLIDAASTDLDALAATLSKEGVKQIRSYGVATGFVAPASDAGTASVVPGWSATKIVGAAADRFDWVTSRFCYPYRPLSADIRPHSSDAEPVRIPASTPLLGRFAFLEVASGARGRRFKSCRARSNRRCKRASSNATSADPAPGPSRNPESHDMPCAGMEPDRNRLHW